MEEKKSFKQRFKSMPTKRKIVALVIMTLIVAVPVGAVAYQLNHKKSSKTDSKNGKSSSSKGSGNSGSNGVGGQPGKKTADGSAGAGAVPSRVERFNKDQLAKRIDQALQSKRITDAQAKALNKKLAEIDKFVGSNKSKNVQDQNKAASDKRKDLQKWAKDNNIPARYIAGWL